MAENSKIEWTHHSWSPWRGCTKVSAGCAHCYADTMSKRNPSVLGVWGRPNLWVGTSCENQATADERIPHLLSVPAAVRFLSLEPLLGPVDLLRVKWPNKSEHRVDVLRFGYWEDRDVFYKGFVNHGDMHDLYGKPIQWVIVGGESGPGARPCNVEWIRSIVQQCKAAGVACFVKQLGDCAVTDEKNASWSVGSHHSLGLVKPKGGNMAEWPEDLRVRQFPNME